MDHMEKSFKVIQDLIDRAFSRFWSGDADNMSAMKMVPRLYESIDQYTKVTGKRFRMTKEQKSRGLSRDEAFSEFVKTLS